MEGIFISLFLDLTSQASQGPGWYIAATIDGAPVIQPIALPPEAALKLSGAFLTALEASDSEIPQVTPFQIVMSGNGVILAALDKQLAEAEEQARRVAMLRRKRLTIAPSAPVNPEPHATVEE